MRPTPRTLAELLLQRTSPLSALLGQIRLLAQADQRLREALGSPLADHVRLANIRDEHAVVLVDSASTLTLLRFRQHELIQVLRSVDGIRCQSLEIAIDPMLSRL